MIIKIKGNFGKTTLDIMDDSFDRIQLGTTIILDDIVSPGEYEVVLIDKVDLTLFVELVEEYELFTQNQPLPEVNYYLSEEEKRCLH